MTLTHKLYRGAATLALGKVGSKIFAMVRLVILARMLTLEDMGIVSMLMLTVALLEMLSQLGADKLLIQAHDGDDPRFQGCVHVTRISRGVFNALVLLIIAVPMARLFKAEDAWPAFAALAVVPLIRGFVHTDVLRSQRGLRYAPLIKVELISSVLAAASAAPLALWLGDYRAGLGCIIIKALAYTVTTHVVATRPYRLAWDRAVASRLFHFGWPMLINSALLYAITHGDKLIVGRYYTPADLGVYAVAFGLAMTARMTVAGALNSLFLPVLASTQDHAERFAQRLGVLATMLALCGVLLAVPLVVAGGDVMSLIYGAKYSTAGAFVGWLAAMQAVRLVRTAPSIAAQARADSLTLMFANIVRASFLAPALAAALGGAPLVVLARWGLAGEVAALGTMALLLRRSWAVPLATIARPVLWASAVTAATAAAGLWASRGRGEFSTLVIAGVATLAAAGLLGGVLRDARRVVRTLAGDVGTKLRPAEPAAATDSAA